MARNRFGITLALTLSFAVAGCGVLPSTPPAIPDTYVPELTLDNRVAPQGNLTPYGFSEAQRMAVRVRNVGCTSVTRGTGFAIDGHTLITNRHVVEGTAQLQLNTYDGKDVSVTSSSVAGIADLALVRTEDNLEAFPVLAEADPVPGDHLTVVGYPNGGKLTVTSGEAIKYTKDPLNENLGEVLYSSAEVEHGSSGSAVLDDEGRLVGVVYAKNAAGESYIIPVSTLLEILEQDEGFEAQTAVTCQR